MPAASYPRIIWVSLRGEASSLFHILEDDIEAYVDMGRYNMPGTYTVPVQWRKRGSALGADPIQITVNPIEITFSLDYKISKFVPITANFRGNVVAGYNITSYSLNPFQVIIDGPAGLMGSIFELPTEPIDLDGRRSDFSLTVNVINNDPLIFVRGNGTSDFSGIIGQIIPVRNILNVPIVITGMREGFTGRLEINTGNIHLEGENHDAVNSFEPDPDFLRVDCSGISEPGTYVLRVLTWPVEEGISLRIDPEEVSILISYSVDEVL
jgi:hypothetical protein